MIIAPLSREQTQALIAYARRKYAEERFPFAAELRELREALAKLDPKPTVDEVQPPARPYVPASIHRKKRR